MATRDDRAERLAAQLRANLRRRKAPAEAPPLEDRRDGDAIEAGAPS